MIHVYFFLPGNPISTESEILLRRRLEDKKFQTNLTKNLNREIKIKEKRCGKRVYQKKNV
jgi:hypothetical protein